jgi:hypothetical protein
VPTPLLNQPEHLKCGSKYLSKPEQNGRRGTLHRPGLLGVWPEEEDLHLMGAQRASPLRALCNRASASSWGVGGGMGRTPTRYPATPAHALFRSSAIVPA